MLKLPHIDQFTQVFLIFAYLCLLEKNVFSLSLIYILHSHLMTLILDYQCGTLLSCFQSRQLFYYLGMSWYILRIFINCIKLILPYIYSMMNILYLVIWKKWSMGYVLLYVLKLYIMLPLFRVIDWIVIIGNIEFLDIGKSVWNFNENE